LARPARTELPWVARPEHFNPVGVDGNPSDLSQGSLADSATLGLTDTIPLGLAESGPGLEGQGKRMPPSTAARMAAPS